MKSFTKEKNLVLNNKTELLVKYTEYPDDEMTVIETIKQTKGELEDLFEWINDKMELEIARTASRRFATYDNLYQILEEEISRQ
jgi:hypothetical protein